MRTVLRWIGGSPCQTIRDAGQSQILNPRSSMGEAVRICSFLPSATEILFALGLGDQVVGVTHECDYPPAARERPVVVHSTVDPAVLSSAEIEAAGRASLAGGHRPPRGGAG